MKYIDPQVLGLAQEFSDYWNPLIFGDGCQSRDFTYISDMARTNLLALESTGANNEVLNIETGRSIRLLEVCEKRVASKGIGKFREGDLRYCFADATQTEKVLGFQVEVRLEEGIRELIHWLRDR